MQSLLLGPFEPTKNGGMAPVLPKESEKVQTRMGTISVDNMKGQWPPRSRIG